MSIVALDKTGTITKGQPKVTDLVPAAGVTERTLLQLAYDLEQKSEHPLAKAVVEEALSRKLAAEAVDDFSILPGNGLTAKKGDSVLLGGSLSYIKGSARLDPSLERQAEALAEKGRTPLLFALDGTVIGMIAVADVIKEDSPKAIKELQKMGLTVVMLTGDNEKTAESIGREAGVDRVIAGVLPDGKETVIRELQKYGRVAMVGDGINDAPALTRADIGIAIGAGADVAIDSADIVLMNSKLTDVSAAVRLSRSTVRNIHENLFWAFFYNVICIPLAAGLIPGIKMNPMVGAAAMSLSSFTVCMNALRLNLTKIHDASGDKAKYHVEVGPVSVQKAASQKKKAAEQVPSAALKEDLVVTGMTCSHCEAHVKKALEALPGVVSAVADHTQNKVHIVLSAPLDEKAAEAAVIKAGYRYGGIMSVGEEKETLHVTGMMCAHCEGRVKKALESLPSVVSAMPSHETGEVQVVLSAPLDHEAARAVIEKAGYELK